MRVKEIYHVLGILFIMLLLSIGVYIHKGMERPDLKIQTVERVGGT